MASDTNEANPYEAPKAGSDDKPAKRRKKKAGDSSDADADARSRIVDAFMRTRKWLTLFGVLSYIGAAGLAAQSASTLARVYGGASFVISVVVFLGLGALYIVIGARLFRYRDAIDNVVAGEGELGTVANAVERQQEWWAFIGRVTLVGVVLLFAGVVLYGVLGFLVVSRD